LLRYFGIGVDIEKINRFRRYSESNDLSLKKIFTERELRYCFSKKNPAQHLAVRFAGKEAVIKALNDIMASGIEYNKIEILHNKKNTPVVNVSKKIIKNVIINVSLSHTEDNAIAFVTVIQE